MPERAIAILAFQCFFFVFKSKHCLILKVAMKRTINQSDLKQALCDNKHANLWGSKWIQIFLAWDQCLEPSVVDTKSMCNAQIVNECHQMRGHEINTHHYKRSVVYTSSTEGLRFDWQRSYALRDRVKTWTTIRWTVKFTFHIHSLRILSLTRVITFTATHPFIFASLR